MFGCKFCSELWATKRKDDNPVLRRVHGDFHNLHQEESNFPDANCAINFYTKELDIYPSENVDDHYSLPIVYCPFCGNKL